jgi:YVTN family beta-propeller protein
MRLRHRFLLLPAALLLTSVPALAADGLLIVLNKSDHNAALVDPANYKVLATLPTGQGPHEAAASPDGSTAYVSNYGAYAIFQQGAPRDFAPGHTITVLDLANRKVKATFDLGGYKQPHGIRVSRDARRLWVTTEGAQAVLELDAASGKILRSWKTDQNISHMLVPTPSEKKLYVANIGSGSVTVIDRETDIVKSIRTGAGAEGIDVTPDGSEVWVVNREANTVSVISTASDSVVATFESGGQFPIRIKFTPDGSQAWVSNAQSNTVTVFDTESRQLLDTIEVGAVPVGILMTPDGSRAFVANTNANQVTVIDVPARKVLTTFTTGTEPDGMAWAD